MAEHLEAGLSRQLRLIIIPVVLSLLFFFIIGLSLLGPFFGRQVLMIPMFLLVSFFVAAFLAARAILKKQLKMFPSREIFANILRMDGWQLS
jgi:uncharacterized protein YneF (UPF0154 family)